MKDLTKTEVDVYTGLYFPKSTGFYTHRCSQTFLLMYPKLSFSAFVCNILKVDFFGPLLIEQLFYYVAIAILLS